MSAAGYLPAVQPETSAISAVSLLPAADIAVNFGSRGRRENLALFSLAANNPIASDQSVMLT